MYGLKAIAQRLYSLLSSAPALSGVRWYYGRIVPEEAASFPAGYVTGLAGPGGERYRELPRGQELRWVCEVWLGTRAQTGVGQAEDQILDLVDAVFAVIGADPTLGLAHVVSAQPELGGVSTSSNPEAGAYAEALIRVTVQALPV